MVEVKEVERISYRPLAIDFYLFMLLMVGQSLQKTGALSMNFVTEVEMRKWSFDAILPSKKVSDQISANSLAKGSSIFSL